MNSPNSCQLDRRDWLKALALGGAATLLTTRQSTARTSGTPSGKVKGVVFMVSDGMSPGVITLAEAYSQLTRKRGTRWWQLFNDRSAVRGLMDNTSANSLVTDSAAASSAWGGGQRVNNGSINFGPDNKEITPVATLLKQKSDARIGLVTTATVTHATPAGFAASVPGRGDEAEIAPQYLNRVDIVLGGGSGYFDPKLRPDHRDLAGDFAKAGYQIINSRAELIAASGQKLLGTFTLGHLPFSIDRDHNESIARQVPTLTEMAIAALTRFLASNQPFLLQVEGARIDHAAHLNDIAALLADQLAFDDTIAAVLAKIAGRDDILVVVTSDHGNSNPGLNGTGKAYTDTNACFAKIADIKASHEQIFGEWKSIINGEARQLSDLIRTHMGFTPCPSEADALLNSLSKRPVVQWSHQLDKPEGLLGQITGNHTGIGWCGTSHTSDPTLVSAIGPQSERFSGIVVNTDVFKHFMEMLA